MTTKFRTRDEALQQAIQYAGSTQNVSELTELGKGAMSQWGTTFPVDLFEIDGQQGKCRVGIEKFRDGMRCG